MVTLGVSDLDRSIEFYETGLGLPRKEGPEGIAFFETQGTMLSLYGREKLAEDITISAEGTGFQGFTLAHNIESPEAVAAGAELINGRTGSLLGRIPPTGLSPPPISYLLDIISLTGRKKGL